MDAPLLELLNLTDFLFADTSGMRSYEPFLGRALLVAKTEGTLAPSTAAVGEGEVAPAKFMVCLLA